MEAWLSKQKKPEKPRRSRTQTRVIALAAQNQTHHENHSATQLQPLLNAVNAAGNKQLTVKDLRKLLRAACATAAKQRDAEVAAASQPE